MPHLKPIIINSSSTFVVVTYWWGRGNKNKNTQRPCPEDLEPDQKLTTRPITYNKMIDNWKRQCRKHKCNYMAVEYPEFAQKGMYQLAINYKPIFIEEALKACYPRGVLYIDGDIDIKRYPRIFDMPGVDYMAQGWNSDPRYRAVWEGDPAPSCYYPYVFETSGGTMFFGNTDQAKHLLREWTKSVKKYPEKAEDRLISQIFNNQRLLLPLNSIQLPIEYLWLTQLYDDNLDRGLWNRRKIFIEHPECLTGAERAQAEGSGKDRWPARYDYQITNQVRCFIKKMPFYEYIFFPTKADVASFDKYLITMKTQGVFEIIPYNKRYGQYNAIVKENVDRVKAVTLEASGTVYITFRDLGKHDQHIISNARDVIPTILAYLKRGNEVVYVPRGATKQAAERARKMAVNQKVDFVCRNKNTKTVRYKKEYTLTVEQRYPMYFSNNSRVLVHLLYMSKTFGQLAKHYNQSFIFPSRIRCAWI